MSSKAVVLIVDQDKILVDLLSQKLAGDTIEVLGTQSAEHARTMFSEIHPDILIIDPMLPDGMPLLEAILSSDDACAVIGLTQTEAIRTRLASMCVECIDKANGLAPLLEAVQACIDSDAADPEAADEDVGAEQILVVDDDESVIEVMSFLLTQWGYSPLVARGGAEALEMIQSHPSLAIVLLDVRLPDIGGLEILATIQSMNPAAGVIMMSGLADREIACHAIRLGAFDYITKPMDFNALESTLVACLSHTEYRRQSWWKRLTS